MRWKLMLIISLLVLPTIVLAQAVPQDTDTSREQLIVQEHKNTRKFVSDEITRQRNDFFKTMEKEGAEYEKKANSIVSDAVWKLGLMWAGISFFVFGVAGFIGRRLDKRKWNKMLDSAKEQLKAEATQQKTQIDQQKAQVVQQQKTVQDQASALAKAKPQLVAMHQKMQQDQKKLQEVMKELGVGGQ